MLWLAKAIIIKLICQINYYYFTRITRWNITMLLTNTDWSVPQTVTMDLVGSRDNQEQQ